ncbi:TPA: oligosaccharide flippase family protein, partial [Streptococcus suis]|nr:oligosaccharide flippase family protein [Streptococcus suis]
MKRNFIYSSLYQVLLLIIPLLTTPYLSRVLGAQALGEFSYHNSIAYYFVIFIMLGLNNYGSREIAKNRDSISNCSRLFWSIYSLQMILGIAINFLYLVYVVFMSKNILLSSLFFMYTLSAAIDINWFFWGIEEFKKTTIRNMLSKLVVTLSIFFFVKDESDLPVYVFLICSNLLITQIILWPYVFRKLTFYVPNINEILSHLKPNLFLFFTVLAVSVYKIMAKIMLGVMNSNEQLGFYESSERVIQVPMAFITALGNVMLPKMSNLVVKNKEQSPILIGKSLRFVMLLSSSMSFGIMAVSKEFVPLFYGDGFEICILLFLILLPSCLFLAFSNVFRTQYLLPNQKDSILIQSVFIGAIVNVVINYSLIPSIGAVGAALATLGAEFAVTVHQTFRISKELNTRRYIIEAIFISMLGLPIFIFLYNLEFHNVSLIYSLFTKIL